MLLLALLLPALAQPLPGDAEIVELGRELQEIRELVRGANNRGLSSAVDERLQVVEAKLKALDDARYMLVDHAALLEADVVACPRSEGREVRARLDGGLDARAAPETPPPAQPIDKAELDRIRAAVRGATFSDDKLQTLASALRDRHVTVAQVRAIMGWFSFGKDKVEAAAMLHARVVDPQDWYLVYGALSFESDKRALRQRVGD